MKKELSELGFKKGDGATIIGLYTFIEQMSKTAGALGLLNPEAAKALNNFDSVKPAFLKLAGEVDK